MNDWDQFLKEVCEQLGCASQTALAQRIGVRNEHITRLKAGTIGARGVGMFCARVAAASDGAIKYAPLLARARALDEVGNGTETA